MNSVSQTQLSGLVAGLGPAQGEVGGAAARPIEFGQRVVEWVMRSGRGGEDLVLLAADSEQKLARDTKSSSEATSSDRRTRRAPPQAPSSVR